MSSTGSDTGFLSRLTKAPQSLAAATSPWSDFLDLSTFSLPLSISDATTRISQNLTRYLSNYTLITLLILVLSLIFKPLSLIIFLGSLSIWVAFYSSRADPLTLCGLLVDDRVVICIMFLAMVIILAVTHALVNVLVSFVGGAVLVICHAGLRGTDDLVITDGESPFGILLDDLGDGDSPRGSYTGI